jgi:hypothetical protein
MASVLPSPLGLLVIAQSEGRELSGVRVAGR